jgi:hypothetical protein
VVCRALILLAALVAVFLLASCAQNSAAPQPKHEQQDNKQIPSTARIVCDQEGTRVLTPTVEAQPDGVHFVIDNRLKAGTGGYTVALPQSEGPLYSGAGGNAPRGMISKHIEPFSPGTVKISCNPPEFSGEEEELDYASFKVLKGESGYKSAELECSGGGWVQSGGGLYAGGVKGKKSDPVEMTRQRFSDQIEEGDVVEIAGYPEIAHSQILGDSRYVRVIREGRVVAVVRYFREGGGWLEGEYSVCEGF